MVTRSLMLLGRAPSRYKYRGSKSVREIWWKFTSSKKIVCSHDFQDWPCFQQSSNCSNNSLVMSIRYGTFNVVINVPSPCSIQYVPAWVRRAGKTSSNIAEAMPGFKLDDIQSYVALAACVGTYIVSSKHRKFGPFSLASALGSCSPVENWFMDTCRAN